jgi:hypothetical protein
MMTKTETLSFDDVFTYLVAFEAYKLQHQTELDMKIGASAHYVGRGGYRGHGDRGRGGHSCGGAPSRGDHRGSGSRPECQICGKVGHTAIRCWYRMDDMY